MTMFLLWSLCSILLCALYSTYELLVEDTHYDIVHRLMHGKVSLLLFGNALVATTASLVSALLALTLGQIRELETQTVSELFRNILMDTVLFLIMANPTIKGREVPHGILIFSLATTIGTKIIHAISSGRIAHAAEPGGRSWVSLKRLALLLVALAVWDTSVIGLLWPHASLQNTFLIWNVFEFAGFLSSTLNNFLKLLIIYVDFGLEQNPELGSPGGWPYKTEHLYLIDALRECGDLVIYVTFVAIFSVANPARLPAYLATDLFTVARSLSERISSFYQYRRLLRTLDTHFVNATEEEVAEHETCIICRDQLNTSAKKLQCGHILHLTCMKSWFVNHQSCPICRADIRISNNLPPFASRGVSQPASSRRQNGGSDGHPTGQTGPRDEFGDDVDPEPFRPFSYPDEKIVDGTVETHLPPSFLPVNFFLGEQLQSLKEHLHQMRND